MPSCWRWFTIAFENNLHDIDDRNGENSNCSAEHGEGSSAMDSLRQLPKLSSLPVRRSTVHFQEGDDDENNFDGDCVFSLSLWI